MDGSDSALISLFVMNMNKPSIIQFLETLSYRPSDALVIIGYPPLIDPESNSATARTLKDATLERWQRSGACDLNCGQAMHCSGSLPSSRISSNQVIARMHEADADCRQPFILVRCKRK